MSENNNDFGAFLAGFVIGGLVGAATALILAPQSGEEMRGQLSQKSVEWRDMGTERVHQYQEKAQTVVGDARLRTHDASAHLQDQARLVLDKGKERVGRIKSAEELAAEGADTVEDAVEAVEEEIADASANDEGENAQ